MRSACGWRGSARRVQVLAVTHAPQVAARADHHYLISKDALDKGKRVATRVDELPADTRREEIARMLAGAEITAEARAAAERLIERGEIVNRTSAGGQAMWRTCAAEQYASSMTS